MELWCKICGRVNKIAYGNMHGDGEKKETIVKCAYCGAEICCVNDSREVYSIEWNDEWYN